MTISANFKVTICCGQLLRHSLQVCPRHSIWKMSSLNGLLPKPIWAKANWQLWSDSPEQRLILADFASKNFCALPSYLTQTSQLTTRHVFGHGAQDRFWRFHPSKPDCGGSPLWSSGQNGRTLKNGKWIEVHGWEIFNGKILVVIWCCLGDVVSHH